ncbi:MAG: DUF4430 domain-containing protein [Patescibacteria group bacterium]
MSVNKTIRSSAGTMVVMVAALIAVIPMLSDNPPVNIQSALLSPSSKIVLGEQAEKLINVTLEINNSSSQTSYNAEVPVDTDVMTLTRQVADTNNLTLAVKDYGEMGKLVEGIGGTDNDTVAGKYWLYYVNGEYATVGASQQIVKEGDVISWRYGE